jgi:hypothetical protein
MNGWIEWLPLWLWLPAAALFLLLGLAAWLAPRSVHLRVRAGWRRLSPPAWPRLRYLFSAGLTLLTALLLFVLSDGETQPVRLAATAAGGITAWLVADFAWRSARDAARRRAALSSEWAARAATARSRLAETAEEPLFAQTACRVLCETLGCSRAALFLEEGGEFHQRAAFPQDLNTGGHWPASSILVRELARLSADAPLFLADPRTGAPRPWASTAEAAASQARLDAFGAVLALPVHGGAQLDAFFLIGPLEHGLQYGPVHVAFLEQFACSTAVLLRSLSRTRQLAEKAADDARQQARRATVRLALSALEPPEDISLPDLDCAGIASNQDECRVFLDLIPLPGRAAAFAAVEFDSGFEEAAIRMVQLQALLRTRARAYHDDLAELAESTRRAMLSPGAGWPAARIFLACYRSGARRLQYINAGFLPPFLFRRTALGAEALRLRHTGPPFESRTGLRCEEAEIELAPGDLLLAVSSTVPAGKNSSGEPCSEVRLVETMSAWQPAPAQALLDQAAASWREFLGPESALPPHLFLLLRPKP